MTSPTTIGPEPQRLEGRSVRDIVEYSPEQVNDAWCRRIFRQILQSLELQYAMHMPRRAITPDTIVFHENGEPLLTPLDIGPPDEREAEDLNALARVVHYAITQELVPAGPLQGRVEGYGAALLDAVDRCMDPDPARRPQTIDALRDLLGIAAPGAPVRGAAPHIASDLPADDLAPPPTGASAARLHDGNPAAPHDSAQHGSPPVDARPAVPSNAASDFLLGRQGPDHGEAQDGTDRNGVHTPLQVPADETTHDTRDPAEHAVHAEQHGPERDDTRSTQATAGHADAHDMHDVHAAAGQNDGDIARHAPDHDGMHAAPPAPGHDHAPRPAPAPSAAPPVAPLPHTAPPRPDATATAVGAAAGAPGRRTALSSRQRWALAAGIAVFVALALATFSELRDSGPIEHIDLAAPQPADAARAVPETAAPAPAAPPGSVAAPAGASAPAAPAAVAGAGVTAGLAPGETIVPGSAMPAPGVGAQPLPGVVVTPHGNVYRLQIQPWGVVYVDGVDSGVSPPVKRLTLAPGRHTIRITNPNFQERVLDVDTATGDGQISVDFTDTSR